MTPPRSAEAQAPGVRQRAAEIRSELGDPEHVILGMDRLDYTKGIDLRLKAFASLLDNSPRDRPPRVRASRRSKP